MKKKALPEEKSNAMEVQADENLISRRRFISKSGKVIALGFLASFSLAGKASADDMSAMGVCAVCNIWGMCDTCNDAVQNPACTGDCVTPCQMGCQTPCDTCQTSCQVGPCMTPNQTGGYE